MEETRETTMKRGAVTGFLKTFNQRVKKFGKISDQPV
jgi:hypothetical protein